MPTQVAVPACTTVLPASRTSRTGRPARSAWAAMSISAFWEAQDSTILGIPAANQVAWASRPARSTAPTAAWAT